MLISPSSALKSPPDSVPKAPAALSAYSVFFGVDADGAADGADAVVLAPSASAFSLAFLALRSAFFWRFAKVLADGAASSSSDSTSDTCLG